MRCAMAIQRDFGIGDISTSRCPEPDRVTIEVTNDGQRNGQNSRFRLRADRNAGARPSAWRRLDLMREPEHGLSVTATLPFPAASIQVRAASFAGDA